MIDAQDPERVDLSLVVDAHGRDGPATHDLARGKGLFRALEVARCELVDEGEDALAELPRGDRVALSELTDHGREVRFRLRCETEHHRWKIESMVCRT